MILTVHQPDHLPYLGFFDKVLQADVYVVLDNVQFKRRWFEHRNRIRTEKGWEWVCVPVKKSPQPAKIKEIMMADEWTDVRNRNIELIKRNYSKAPMFRKIWDEFLDVYMLPMNDLLGFNFEILGWMAKKFINVLKLPELHFQSDKETKGSSTDLIIEICKMYGADEYLSGVHGIEYLDVRKMEDAGIGLLVHDFEHPVYRQQYSPFEKNLSALDLLFNEEVPANFLTLKSKPYEQRSPQPGYNRADKGEVQEEVFDPRGGC